MNPFFHFFFNYLILSIFFPNIRNYIFLVLFFSIALDLDHLPYYLRNYSLIMKNKFRLNAEVKSRFHELFGIAVFTIFFLVIYLIIRDEVVILAYISLVLHIIIDLLTVRTRLFYPFSKKEYKLIKVDWVKFKIIESAITLIFGYLFIITYF